MKTETSKQVEKINHEYQAKLAEGIQVCDLGSCQYKTIQDTAEWALQLMEVMGEKEFEKKLGITYERKITDIVAYEHFLAQGIQEFIGEEPEILKEDGYDTVEEMIADKFPEYVDDFRDGRLSVQAYVEITQDQAWDLWSALVSPLDDFAIAMAAPQETPVYGPILNQMAQSDNFERGIALAYILYLWGREGITMKTFAGYDT